MFLLAEVRAFEPLSVVHHDKLRVNKVSLQTLECVSRANRIFHSIASCVVDVKRNAVHFTLTADFKILAIVDAEQGPFKPKLVPKKFLVSVYRVEIVIVVITAFMEIQEFLLLNLEVQTRLQENLKPYVCVVVQWFVVVVVDDAERNFELVLTEIDHILRSVSSVNDLVCDVGVVLREHLHKLRKQVN
jgi:hypothetical protein